MACVCVWGWACCTCRCLALPGSWCLLQRVVVHVVPARSHAITGTLAPSVPAALCRRVYGMEAVYVHDAAALAAVLDPSLFEWHEGAVVVVTDGPAKGRTIRDEGGWVAGVCLPWAHVLACPAFDRSWPACIVKSVLLAPLYNAAGLKRWVGCNEWQGLPAVKVALGVRSQQLVEWVLDRMTR